MITAIIDWDGDITLAGVSEDQEHQTCIMHGDDWHIAGIVPDTEYTVDSQPFDGAKHLLKNGFGMYWQTYLGEDDNVIYFCTNKLLTVFGEVPERIYYKEV